MSSLQARYNMLEGAIAAVLIAEPEDMTEAVIREHLAAWYVIAEKKNLGDLTPNPGETGFQTIVRVAIKELKEKRDADEKRVP